MGFTFDNDNEDATPVEEMRSLLETNPVNKERIFPFIGGEEVNSSHDLEPRRFIISFEDWPLARREVLKQWRSASEAQRDEWLHQGIVPLDYPGPVAEDFPDLLAIVTSKVKPERDRDKRLSRRNKWWRYGEVSPGFFDAVRRVDRLLVNSAISTHLAFTFLPGNWVYAHTLNTFVFREY